MNIREYLLKSENVEEDLITKSVEEIDELAEEVIKGKKANLKKADEEEEEKEVPEKEEKEEAPEEEGEEKEEVEEKPEEDKEDAPPEEEGEKEEGDDKEEKEEKEDNVNKEKPETPADEISKEGDGTSGEKDEDPKEVKKGKKVKKSEDVEEIEEDEDKVEKSEEEEEEEEKVEKSFRQMLEENDKFMDLMEKSEFFTEFSHTQVNTLDRMGRDIEKSLECIDELNMMFEQSNASIEKSLESFVYNQNALNDLVKSQTDLINQQTELIKSLEKRIDELEHKPVGRKAVLDVVEKSFNQSIYQPTPKKELSKGEVLNKMSNMLMNGVQGITVDDIINYETTGFLNKNVKDLIDKA